MIKQKQANLHKPEEGIYGDCYRTAIACLLDLDRDDVPNWAEESKMDKDIFWALQNKWLAEQRLAMFSVGFNFESLKAFQEYMQEYYPTLYYILDGTSKNGTNHSVIGLGGSIHWDPAIDNSGIIGPMDDGNFWVSVLTPSD